MKKKELFFLKERIYTILMKNIFLKKKYIITITNVLFNKNFTELYVYFLSSEKDINFVSILNQSSFFIKKSLISELKIYKLKSIFFIYDDNILRSIYLIDTLDNLKNE